AVLRSAVTALSAPEAPLVLAWVAGDIAHDERFAQLAQHAQIVLYNSSLVDNERAALCQLVEYLEHHPHLALADVAYLRLGPWQESVATFFDGKDAGALFELRHVEVTCGSDPEAYYLLGWLSSRLQWKTCSDDAFLDRHGEKIAFEIRREGAPRRISSVRLQSANVRFLAEADDEAETIHLSVCGDGSERHRYRAVVNPGIATLLERAILWGQNDRIFRDSLRAAGDILACRKERP
ncbi:MAG: glucose-6-phosphate dehydrogenase assembly protein OpcA, partial [Candidatus Eremiobacteraeota bacterium]|nr:glucose-6-phosphate dehydrogenase assembly protein OpcA [Candidatus Eremiobacteraeota bacterium]